LLAGYLPIFDGTNNTILFPRSLYLTHNTNKISRFEFNFTLNHSFVDLEQKIQIGLACPAFSNPIPHAVVCTAWRSR
jgi:hypothetical protein